MSEVSAAAAAAVTPRRKRQLCTVPFNVKVEAVMRVLNGESRCYVRKSIGRLAGTAESTFRGWLKRPEIVDEARRQLQENSLGMTSPIPPSMPCWDVMSLAAKRSINSGSENEREMQSDLSDTSNGCRYESDASLPSHVHQGCSERLRRSNENKRPSKRAPKRKRVQSDSTDDDLPIAKRPVKETRLTFGKCENQQVDELESRHCTELLTELAARNTVSTDMFLYLWEVLQ